ncbi:beta-galactosidase [Aquibacillus halophilus]|uniref:Beta-galactosidase n=1 Tax=Aquibacillus halophilus TaxID=930132 RepID=A0A6A8DHI7_9BACI|nr:beta-galactosidase family protein [Aquibacillus halophilus]MRH43299.1 beta-galactosidase [Aquibacillus halophilus]
MNKLHVEGKDLKLNNEHFQVISGAIHYFRIVPEYWEDRLLKLKACGFNCVETYIPWNLHEPKEGEFNFEGIADVESFVRIAEKVGLYVILRPSPYICAEWEFGGLPAWLLADKNMRVRSYHKPYLEKVDQYYNVLLQKLKPLQITHNGPVIAMQVENEYGSFGNDKTYLNYIKENMINRGIDVLLFTSDGPTDLMLKGGTIPGVLATLNFGSKPKESFEKLAEHEADLPNICMEYWNGWFDHWGEEHHQRDPKEAADTFGEMLENGDNVNFYMFHGGTNFGFFNGANHSDKYEPTVTSYDYDCPLSESGDLTPKFYAVREAIAKYKDIGDLILPKPIPKKNYGVIKLTQVAPLFKNLENLSEVVHRTHPETMEQLGQSYGFILYKTKIHGPQEEQPLIIQDVRDRALVFVNGNYMGVIDRWNENSISFAVPKEGVTVEILVENMGRINYGPQLIDPKGITEGVRFERQFLYDWEISLLPLDDLSKLDFQRHLNIKGPGFFKGTLEVQDKGDTFIELPNWVKGVVFINGFNIGRYWEIGPQRTLYVPAPLLKEGTNEIIIFDLHSAPEEKIVNFTDTPILG